MNMDKMIGGQFERGLTEMKSLVEHRPSDSGDRLVVLVTKS